ncbi:MAG: hypothetical protein E7179_02925 [Erysipelotrichaceae bacterium]|jgi:16S rRNA C967 or C1407 C5-methylase (RsmB/RsmF family)|nr:hypothetical protein [Erysipelotrichaceae bacterium]
MKQLDLSLEILTEVLERKKTFAVALKDKFKNDLEIRPLRADVAGLVGCELRHHLLFSYLTKELEGYEEKDRLVLSLVLANDYYFRHFSPEDMEAAAKDYLSEEKLLRARPLLDAASSDEHIPESVSRSSAQYLSLRYNTPEWVLKIFKHFGFGDCLKTLKRFSRPPVTTLRVRESEVSSKSLLENPDYVATEVESVLAYHGKTPLRKVPAFQEEKVFLEKPLTKKIIEEHLIAEPCELLLYNGNADSSLEKEIIETYGEKIGINLATPNVDAKLDVSRLIKSKGLHNVNFFSAPDPLSMEASISRMQDLVIAAPDSTNFDLIPASPDYLVCYDRDKMDALFEQEKNVLEGAAKYVSESGKLVYIIYTISKKEGPMRISEFLKVHPEFHLESHRQYFPFQEHMTAAYVAVLQKGEKELTVAPTLGELGAISSVCSCSQASSSEAMGD